MKLEYPSIKYKESYLNSIREFHAEGRHLDLRIEELEKDFEGYIEGLERESRGEDLKVGLVPQTTFWAIDNRECVGRISIRHYLNDNLKKFGGHIGYDISPTKRKKGYGTEMLQMVLSNVRGMGLKKVLITCSQDNIASIQIIKKAGGVFDKVVEIDLGHHTVLHFWISLEN